MNANRRTVLHDLLTLDQKASLEAIYLAKEVATDQLRRAPNALADIVDAFHAATGRTDIDAALLLRYMFNRRKAKDWPRLCGHAQRFKPVANVLSPCEQAQLKTIYESLDITSDDLLFSAGLIRRIAQQFRVATGKVVLGSILIAVIVAKRRRGDWVRIRTGDVPFADIAQVARDHKTA